MRSCRNCVFYEESIGNVVECELKGTTRMPEYCWHFRLSRDGIVKVINKRDG